MEMFSSLTDAANLCRRKIVTAIALVGATVFLLILAPVTGESVGDAAKLSLGGRLYDNHWFIIGQQPPSGRHPQFPDELDVEPPETWRCVSCHGWDYRGANGQLGKVSQSPIFKNLDGVQGQDPTLISSKLRRGLHGSITMALPQDLLLALAEFLSEGQHDMSDFIDSDGHGRGDPMQGKDIFEGVCQRCHGENGTAPIYGEIGDRSSLGWIIRNRPEQAVHKIRNGVPQADMVSLRFLDAKDLAGLIAYLQTLDKDQR